MQSDLCLRSLLFLFEATPASSALPAVVAEQGTLSVLIALTHVPLTAAGGAAQLPATALRVACACAAVAQGANTFTRTPALLHGVATLVYHAAGSVLLPPTTDVATQAPMVLGLALDLLVRVLQQPCGRFTCGC